MILRPLLASAFALVAFLGLVGCSSSQEARPAPNYGLPSLPARPAFDATTVKPVDARTEMRFASDSAGGGGGQEIMLTGTLAGAPAMRASGGSLSGDVLRTVTKIAGSSSSSGGSRGAGGAGGMYANTLPAGEAVKDDEKIEREAQLAIEVKDVGESAARVLALVRAHEGSVTKDQRTSGSQSTAEMIVRVPGSHFDAFTNELASVGEIRSRNIKAVDSSLEYHDLSILVNNLEAALQRYRDLLGKATDTIQVLAVERELERVRSDLDRIKGRLEFVKDRVSRATIAIALHSPEPLPDVPTGKKPYIAPGVRGLTFIDVRESGTSGYVGTGLTLRLPHVGGDGGRGLILDIDVMRACCKARPERSEWAYDVLTGLDLYSESLQSGRRRWLNPYLGLRVGFSQTQNRGDFAAAGVFGLEIFKTAALMIDLQARVMALVGNPDGPHAAVQPSLGFDLGF